MGHVSIRVVLVKLRLAAVVAYMYMLRRSLLLQQTCGTMSERQTL